MYGLVREEIDTTALGRDVTGAGIGVALGRKTLRIARWRQDTEEVDVGVGGDQVSRALLADLQPVDLLETARAVGEEALPCLRFGGAGERAFLLPGAAVGLRRHVRQGI